MFEISVTKEVASSGLVNSVRGYQFDDPFSFLLVVSN